MVANRDVVAAALEAKLNKPVFASKNSIKVYNRIKVAIARRQEHIVKNILAVHSATSSSRLLIHVALHACVRENEPMLASEILSAAFFRIRSKTFEAVLSLLLTPRAQQRSLWKRPHNRQLTANHVDAPVDPSIIAWRPLRDGLEFFLLAKERRQRRTQASYEALVQALLNKKEYETAAQLFALVVHDHRIIRTRHLREDSADLDYLAAENLKPSHIVLSTICTAIKRALLTLLHNADSSKGVAQSCSQALGCLSSLLHHRQLPFQDITKLLHLMFAFTSYLDRQCAIWIPSTTGPKIKPARDYVRSVVLNLIQNPPSERIPKLITDIDKPLMPPLTWRSYCLLLTGVRDTWEDEALTEVVTSSMIKRFLGPEKTAEDLKTLFDTPRRRREGGRRKSLAADVPHSPQAKTDEKSQGPAESGSRAIAFDELYSWLEAEEHEQDRNAEAVQWTLDEWVLKDQMKNAGLRKDEFADKSVVRKADSPTFGELVEAWHGDKPGPKNDRPK